MRLSKRITEKYFIPGDPDKGWVDIKYLRTNEVQEALADLNDVTYDPTNVDSVSVKMNPYLRMKRMAHASVVGWGNMFDSEGKPLEFSVEDINQVAEFEIYIDDVKFGFYAWVDNCRTDLNEIVQKQKKIALKN